MLYPRFKNWTLGDIIQALGGLASVIGLIVLIVKGNDVAAFIALGAIIVFISLVFARIYFVTRRFLERRYEDRFRKIASFVEFKTDDGDHYVCEWFKQVQFKRLVGSEYNHGFYWSGSEPPDIESDLQDVNGVSKTPEGHYDKVYLNFKKPLLYDESEMVHVKMSLDDSDDIAEPYLETKVDEPIKLVSWRVELRHKPDDFNKKALVKKKKIEAQVSPTYGLITSVPFSHDSKSYTYKLTDPDPGYYYKIEWEK
jgi:hypothetical protein